MRTRQFGLITLVAALLLAGCSSTPTATDVGVEAGGSTVDPITGESSDAVTSGWQDPTWCTDDTWKLVTAAERVPLEEVLELTGLPELPLTGGCAFRNRDISKSIYVFWTQPFVATDPGKTVTGFQVATGLTSDWLKKQGWEYCKTTDTLPPLAEEQYIGFGCWSSQSPVGNPDLITTTYFGHGYEVEGQEAVDSGGATIGFGGSPYVSQGKFYLFDKEPQLLDAESEFFAWSVFR